MASININLGFASQDKDKGYKYKDVSLPLTLDIKRDFVELNDISSIINGITNIFQWRKGERVLEPEFGNNLHQYLYDPINNITAKNIGNELSVLIQRWEPRVKIENIIITPNTDANEYHIEFIYSIPSLTITGAVFETALQKEI